MTNTSREGKIVDRDDKYLKTGQSTTKVVQISAMRSDIKTQQHLMQSPPNMAKCSDGLTI